MDTLKISGALLADLPATSLEPPPTHYGNPQEENAHRAPGRHTDNTPSVSKAETVSTVKQCRAVYTPKTELQSKSRDLPHRHKNATCRN